MLYSTCPVDSNEYVLVVLGHNGHPTFKTIHQEEPYLKKLGEELVALNKSQYIEYMVVSSHNVYTLTHPDYVFDQAVDMIIRNMILNQAEKDLRYQDF